MKKPNITFFGTSQYSVIVLEALKNADMVPTLIIATPDKPAGRNLVLTPPPTKVWALENNIPLIQPEKLKDPSFIQSLKDNKSDVFVVVAYGKIIPEEVLTISPHGALNIHASLLPKFRGASPIESAILANEKETGVTIMLIDKEMDHGPIIAKKQVIMSNWPSTATELGTALVEEGARLLIEILPKWIAKKINPTEQNHIEATYTRKIEKRDGEIDLNDDPYQNYLKIQAFSKWPTAYFFAERNNKKIRVIIKKAKYEDGKLEILRVVPEGKKEMDYSIFNPNA